MIFEQYLFLMREEELRKEGSKLSELQKEKENYSFLHRRFVAWEVRRCRSATNSATSSDLSFEWASFGPSLYLLSCDIGGSYVLLLGAKSPIYNRLAL